MSSPSLSPRLAMCASLARPGKRMADIGTDHGYLPVYLVAQGVCPTAIAADIRPGPLSRARETVKQAGMDSRISLRLGDGLSPVRPEETDDVAITGMGGETIAAILAAAPWCKDGRYRLILQPMSKPEDLREFLFANGFALETERAVREGNRLYTVIRAAYHPQKAAEQAKRPAARYCGELDPADPDGAAFLLRQAKRIESAAAALRKAGVTDRAERLEQTAHAIRQRTGTDNTSL